MPTAGDSTVALTGASGFIGRHLAHRLAANGTQVHCLLRQSSRAGSLQAPNLHCYRGHLADEAFLQESLQGCSIVYHCAALVSDWGSVQEIREANVSLTQRLVQAAGAVGANRFVHVSTTDVYGHPGKVNVSEDFALSQPHFNWYAETKRAAEDVVRTSSLPHSILRPATVYGPGSVSLVGEFVDSIRRGIGFTVGGGNSNAGLVYIDDVVDAIELAGSHSAAVGESFNVCNDEVVTWNTLLSSLAEHLQCTYRKVNLPFSVAAKLGLACEVSYRYALRQLGFKLRPLLSRQAVQVLGIDQSFSYAKANKLLGYQPKVHFAEGLARTMESLS